MAHALCGPSNPIQNLQKHTSVDRTLQQDRLGFRPSPSQGFRSGPGRNAGILDAEYEAFQKGSTQDHGLIEPMHNGYNLPGTFQPESITFPEPPNWASDFQRLGLDGARTTPISSSQFRNEAPLQRSAPSPWHQDFLRKQNMTSPTYSSTMRPMGSTWGQHQGFRPYGTTSGSITQLSPMAQQKQPERHAEDIFDEAAFERAFDAAKKEAEEYSLPKESTDVGSRENIDLRISAEEGLIQSDGGTTKHEQLERSHDLNDTSFDEFLYSADVQMHDELPMGPGMQNFDVDAFLASGTADDGDFETPNNLASTSTAQQEDRLRDEQEANELSYTAGQLLDNLKDEQSQKFKESSFLALMRQLRDKEVRVEGDKMVDVSQPLHPGGQAYPGGDGEVTMSGAIGV